VIQDAVDVAQTGDTVLVTNGVYAMGNREVATLLPWGEWGTNTTRVVVTDLIRLESVNGPSVTAIDGNGSVRCVALTKNAILNGFTLANGYGGYYGGGVRCGPEALVTNCILTGNSASFGGGAYGGLLYNCTVSSNHAAGGGGTYETVLHNSILTRNSSISGDPSGRDYGGAALGGRLLNCFVVGNFGSGAVCGASLYNCTV
jgi:hypothetical protein